MKSLSYPRDRKPRRPPSGDKSHSRSAPWTASGVRCTSPPRRVGYQSPVGDDRADDKRSHLGREAVSEYQNTQSRVAPKRMGLHSSWPGRAGQGRKYRTFFGMAWRYELISGGNGQKTTTTWYIKAKGSLGVAVHEISPASAAQGEGRGGTNRFSSLPLRMTG